MAFHTFKSFVLVFALLMVATHAVTLDSVISSLKDNPLLRCDTGCDETVVKDTLNTLLTACRGGLCPQKDFVLRTSPFGTSSHIQEFCVVSEPLLSSDFAMRIQADLIPEGARLVIVAVPRITRTEPEKFERPFVLSETIPRNDLFIINQMINAYCGVSI